MKTAKELPQFIRDLLSSLPRAGDGVNRYLFRLARVLHPYRSEGEIHDLLRAITFDCGRIVTEQEIQRRGTFEGSRLDTGRVEPRLLNAAVALDQLGAARRHSPRRRRSRRPLGSEPDSH
jgi:hypothetical protein